MAMTPASVQITSDYRHQQQDRFAASLQRQQRMQQQTDLKEMADETEKGIIEAFSTALRLL
jgi:hypothetical protein